MTTTAIRERLYDYIRVADDKKIKAIYTLLEDQVIPQVDWSLDEAVVAELDERVKRYNEGVDRGHTWDELEAEIELLKKKRSVKWAILFYYCLKLKPRFLKRGSGMKKNNLAWATVLNKKFMEKLKGLFYILYYTR